METQPSCTPSMVPLRISKDITPNPGHNVHKGTLRQLPDLGLLSHGGYHPLETTDRYLTSAEYGPPKLAKNHQAFEIGLQGIPRRSHLEQVKSKDPQYSRSTRTRSPRRSRVYTIGHTTRRSTNEVVLQCPRRNDEPSIREDSNHAVHRNQEHQTPLARPM